MWSVILLHRTWHNIEQIYLGLPLNVVSVSARFTGTQSVMIHVEMMFFSLVMEHMGLRSIWYHWKLLNVALIYYTAKRVGVFSLTLSRKLVNSSGCWFVLDALLCCVVISKDSFKWKTECFQKLRVYPFTMVQSCSVGWQLKKPEKKRNPFSDGKQRY